MVKYINYNSIYLNEIITKLTRMLHKINKMQKAELYVYLILKIIKRNIKIQNCLLLLFEVFEILRTPFMLISRQTSKNKKIKTTLKITYKQNTIKQQYSILNWIIKAVQIKNKITIINKMINEIWYIYFYHNLSKTLQKKQQHYYTIQLKKKTNRYRW